MVPLRCRPLISPTAFIARSSPGCPCRPSGRAGSGPPGQPSAHDLRRVAALLHRRGRHAGEGIWPPCPSETRTMSPSTNTSGWPGSVRSRLHATRPTRSRGAPDARARVAASGDAETPAAQMIVRVSRRSCRRRSPARSRPAGRRPSPGGRCARSRPASRAAASPSRTGSGERGEDALGALDQDDARASFGSMWRKSWRTVSRAISAIWPASSTPVGPAPTTTNVSQARCSSGSGSASAASNCRACAAAAPARPPAT